MVRRTTFRNNTYAIIDADKIFEDCVFLYNQYGLYETSSISVYRSNFTGNNIVCMEEEVLYKDVWE